MNADVKLKGEALWTLCNAVSVSNPNDLLNFVMKYKNDLIYPLCYNLTKLAKGETRLLLALIETLEILLSLDKQFPDFFYGSDSVEVMVDRCQGFEALG